jgi:hypothetical protein
MWFYLLAAACVVIVFALWFRRTTMYRHRKAGYGNGPDQVGDNAQWKDPPNTIL